MKTIFTSKIEKLKEDHVDLYDNYAMGFWNGRRYAFEEAEKMSRKL